MNCVIDKKICFHFFLSLKWLIIHYHIERIAYQKTPALTRFFQVTFLLHPSTMLLRIHLRFFCFLFCFFLCASQRLNVWLINLLFRFIIFIFHHVKQSKNVEFSWGNCGPPGQPIEVISLSIGPNPVKLPGLSHSFSNINYYLCIFSKGTVAISVSVNLTKSFPKDLSASISLLWGEISCSYFIWYSRQ